MATNTLSLAGTIFDSVGGTVVNILLINNANAPVGARTSLAANGTTTLTAPANAQGYVITTTISSFGGTVTVNGVLMPGSTQGFMPIQAGVVITIVIAGYVGGAVEIVFV